MMMTTIYNSQTGEITYRELTAEEIAQMEAMQVETEQEVHPTLEERVANIEQVTAEVITILNDKGIAP
jgi:hypothetical protein